MALIIQREELFSPIQSNSKDDVEKVIFTSIVPARSDRFNGAYEGLEFYELDDKE